MPYLSQNYLILRVVNYIFVVVSLILFKMDNDHNIFVLLVIGLSYIINSQFRIMYLNKRKELFFISSLLEGIIILRLSYDLSMYILLLLFITVLDVTLILKKRISIPYLASILSIVYIIIIHHNSSMADRVNSIFMVSVLVVSFAALGLYLKEESYKKRHAQKLYDQLRISEKKLTEANKELELYSSTIEELTLLRERTRVSRELHDSIGHSLSTLIIQLQAIRSLVNQKPKLANDMLDENIRFTKKSLENVRNTVRELKPIEYEAYEGIFTIEEMIKSFVKLTGIQVKFILSKEKWQLTSTQSHNLFRIIQEALSNSLKHGKANSIRVSVQFLKDKIYTQIKDDGIGCDSYKPSFGLKGIKERVDEMKGSFDVITSLDEGFEINIILPKYKETTYVEEGLL